MVIGRWPSWLDFLLGFFAGSAGVEPEPALRDVEHACRARDGIVQPHGRERAQALDEVASRLLERLQAIDDRLARLVPLPSLRYVEEGDRLQRL
eukprot:555898-Prymnesium_polylepis.1